MSDSKSKQLVPGEAASAIEMKTDRPPAGESFFRNKDRQAAEAELKLEAEERERISIELDACRRILTKLIITLSNREIIPERVVLEPSVLLLPFPYINEGGHLEMQVNAMDVDNTCEPYRELFDEMHRLAFFPDLIQKEKELIMPNLPNLASRVNLVKALVVFMEDLIANGSELEKTHEINYLEVAEILGTTNFVPPTNNGIRKFDTFYVRRKVVTVDLVTLLQFQNRLVHFFEQKKREKMGLSKRRSSMSLFADNGGLRARASERAIRHGRGEISSHVEDILRGYLRKPKK